MHIINNPSIHSCSPHLGNNQRFKLNADSLSISEKDIELFYCLIAGLLFTKKNTRPDIKACVTYIFTRMEFPSNYHKDRYLNIDILFVKKIQLFLMSPIKNWCMYFKTLFFKYNKYVLTILQHFTQSRRLNNVFTTLERAYKNMNDWICSNLHKNLIKYITRSQVHTTNNARRATNELMNQGVKTEDIQ